MLAKAPFASRGRRGGCKLSLERTKRPRKTGPLSFVSPVAKSLMGIAAGDVVGAGAQEIEIEIEIASIGSN